MDLEAVVNISGLEVLEEVARVVNIPELEAVVNISGLEAVEVAGYDR